MFRHPELLTGSRLLVYLYVLETDHTPASAGPNDIANFCLAKGTTSFIAPTMNIVPTTYILFRVLFTLDFTILNFFEAIFPVFPGRFGHTRGAEITEVTGVGPHDLGRVFKSWLILGEPDVGWS